MKTDTDRRNAHQQQQVLHDERVCRAAPEQEKWTFIRERPGGAKAWERADCLAIQVEVREGSVTKSESLYICVTMRDVAETEKLRAGATTSS